MAPVASAINVNGASTAKINATISPTSRRYGLRAPVPSRRIRT
jgi:hypothetical protein